MKIHRALQIVSPQYQPFSAELEEIIQQFNENPNLLADGGRNIIKIAKLSNGEEITIKAFKIPNLVNQFTYKYLRKSKARRSFEYAQKLINLGFLSPEPIAFREESSRFKLGHSYFICRLYPADLDFRALLLDPNYPDRKEILKEFTDFTFSLHENGVLFIDHSPGNTLVRKQNNSYTFALVDLNRMDFKRNLNLKERIGNFARLSTNFEDIQLIAHRYAELYQKPKDEVFYRMWLATLRFQKGYFEKKLLRLRFKKS